MQIAVRCPSCGKWSAKTNPRKISTFLFRCVYCRKSSKLKQAKTHGLALQIMGPYDTSKMPKIIAELNRRKT